MKKLILLSFMALAWGCVSFEKDEKTSKPSEADINKVLDDWHRAAAEADFDRYFNHFASDTSIFMGTDATERWTVAQFRPWSKPYFESGQAWNFSAVERYIYFSGNGKTAWFDESLDTPNLGPCRGSGVLSLTENGWKIAHYNLAITVPNELVDTIIPMIDSTLNE